MTATEVRNLISNDLWQATNIDSVGVKEFNALDAAAEKLTENDDRMEFKTLCDQASSESLIPILPKPMIPTVLPDNS